MLKADITDTAAVIINMAADTTNTAAAIIGGIINIMAIMAVTTVGAIIINTMDITGIGITGIRIFTPIQATL